MPLLANNLEVRAALKWAVKGFEIALTELALKTPALLA